MMRFDSIVFSKALINVTGKNFTRNKIYSQQPCTFVLFSSGERERESVCVCVCVCVMKPRAIFFAISMSNKLTKEGQYTKLA